MRNTNRLPLGSLVGTRLRYGRALGCIVLVMLVFAGISSFAQTTIHVPADQPTIQAGIDAASAGDTVLVAPGTYYENIDFKGKAITVTSEGGAAVTTIDGGGIDSVVNFRTGETPTSVLSGFTITHGYPVIHVGNERTGGGIYVSGASPKILDNVITENRACIGVGIFVYQGAPLIQRNLINNNIQFGCGGGNGGGIGIRGSVDAQILDNVIQNNRLDYGIGGGISVVTSSRNVLIRGNIISGNTTSYDGAGIFADDSKYVQIVNNLIVDNKVLGPSNGGGGIYHEAPSDDFPLILGNTIAGNSAADGAGIYLGGYNSYMTMLNNVVVAPDGVLALSCYFSQYYPYAYPEMRSNDIYNGGGVPFSYNCGLYEDNIFVDPLFVAPDVGNYHLQPGSPLIDAGTSSMYYYYPAFDLAGFTRIYDGSGNGTAVIDFGAYEYSGKTTSTLSSDSVTFSTTQKVGTTSSAVTITLSNTGDKILDVSTISIVGDFAQTNTCRIAGGVAAGMSCTIDFVFSPTNVGARSGTATIVSNSTSSPQTITLQGTANAPILSVEPMSLTFGDQAMRTTSAAQVVTIRNTGDFDLIVSSISASGDFASTHTCGTVVPGGSCTASVTFTPQATRTRIGALAIVHDTIGSPSYVPLTGSGVGPEISFSPTSIVFPDQPLGTLSNPVALTVSNTGTFPLTISAVQITGDYKQTNNCVGTLQPGSSCEAAVSFQPLSSGARTGSIAFADDAAASPQSVALLGTGTEPVASLSVNSVTFQQTLIVGLQSITIPVTYKNVGNGTLRIDEIAASSDFSQVNDCAATLDPSASCTIGVTFQPTATGTRVGALQITDNAAGSPRSVPLSGYAIAVYPMPSVGSISPMLFKIGATATLAVSGSNFFPSSVVYWGEQPLATTFSSDTSLTATVPASLVTDYGEYKVSVRTPSPGGGSSAEVTATSYASIPANVREIVYDPNRRLFFASTISPNAILVIDPASRETSSISLSSAPNKLALSDDGQFLYVGLDGAGALARILLPAGTIDFQTSLGPDPSTGRTRTAQDIKVRPGVPYSYVVSLACNSCSPKSAGIVVYDSMWQRPYRIDSATVSSVHGNSLLFINDANTLYGSNIDISDHSFYRFTIDWNGIFLKDSTPDIGGGILASDGTLLYQNRTLGIVDPATPAQVNRYTTRFGGLSYALLPEASTGRLYASESASVDSALTNVLEVADLHSLSPLEYVKVPRTNSADIKTILRWADNGIALQLGTGEIMLLRTALTGTPVASTPAPAPTIAALSPDSALRTSSGLTITVTGSDFQPWSVVKWNGSNRQTTYVDATTLTATLAYNDLATVGTAQVTVFTPAPGGGTSSPLNFSVVGGTISPGSLTFPETTIGLGASSQMVTFQTYGPAGMTVVTPTISGPFAIWSNFCSGTLVESTCTMFIGYVPQVAGVETGLLSVSYTGAPAPLTVTLSGTGVAQIQLSTNSLTFPATNIGSGTSAQRIGVTNRTGANITITPSITGSFYISSNGCAGTLAPNTGCYILVNYLASASGQQTGQLTITPSAGSPQTVSLTGTGVGGDIQMSTTALTFAATNVGSATSSQRVGILNRTGVGITITPALTGSFRITANSCTGTLAPNSGCYLFVQYRATAVGPQTGTLALTPSTGTVHEVLLTGTGQ